MMYLKTLTCQPFDLDGKTHSCQIVITYDYDQVDIGDFDFGSEEENQAYLAKFESGEYFSLIISVAAIYEGCEGVDILGGIHCKSMLHDVDAAINDHGMIDNATSDLVKSLKSQYKSLKLLFEGAA